MNVAVIGASSDRAKFGNKALRAYARKGYDVFPVHPREATIEGFDTFASILDIPVDLDATLVYLSPARTLAVLGEIARKGTRALYLNPGTHDPPVVEKARSLGLSPFLACSILAIGEAPSDY